MTRTWRWLLPCYLFTLPMTVIGWVLATVFYKARYWAWHDGVLTCVAGTAEDGSTLIWGKPNAQTLGWIEIYDSLGMRQFPDIRVHETAHVVQAFACSLVGLVLCPLLVLVLGWSPLVGLVIGGFVGGMGFAILYGLFFVFLLLKRRKGWYDAYMVNPFEVHAYKVQDKYLTDTTSTPWGT